MTTAASLSLRERAQAALEAGYRRLVKLEPELLMGSESETVERIGHELRRLHAAVALFKPALELPKRLEPARIAKVARPFRTLDRYAGTRRALERLQQPGRVDGEHEILAGALADLEARCVKTAAALRAEVTGGRYPALRTALGGWIQRPKFARIAQLPIDTVLPDLLLPSISALLLHPGWLVGAESVGGAIKIDPDIDGKTAERFAVSQAKRLEGLRRAIQRLRHQVEAIPDSRWSVLRRYAEDLETVQRTLSAIADARQGAEFLGRYAPGGAATLPELMPQLTREILVAWREWQPMQRWFLSDETRNPWRLALLGAASHDGADAT